jgi:hypothetical protein
MRKVCLIAALSLLIQASAAEYGGKVEYVGGTVSEVEHGPKGRLLTVNSRYLVYESKQVHYLIPWESINLLEYGQKVSRRLAMAVLISPVLALSKSRKHFLTIGFEATDGNQQALVFRVHKSHIRSLLVSLEMKADLPIEYQDDEARKAGKG